VRIEKLDDALCGITTLGELTKTSTNAAVAKTNVAAVRKSKCQMQTRPSFERYAQTGGELWTTALSPQPKKSSLDLYL
jgi:hypothetical protein